MTGRKWLEEKEKLGVRPAAFERIKCLYISSVD
jgi:hypothetical protein